MIEKPNILNLKKFWSSVKINIWTLIHGHDYICVFKISNWRQSNTSQTSFWFSWLHDFRSWISNIKSIVSSFSKVLHYISVKVRSNSLRFLILYHEIQSSTHITNTRIVSILKEEKYDRDGKLEHWFSRNVENKSKIYEIQLIQSHTVYSRLTTHSWTKIH